MVPKSLWKLYLQIICILQIYSFFEIVYIQKILFKRKKEYCLTKYLIFILIDVKFLLILEVMLLEL